MNATHLHLLLNHVPVVGTAFALVFLGYGLAKNSNDLKFAAYVALVAVGLLAIPVYLTGEPAEDSVKSLPGVSKSIIEQHETAAKAAFVGVLLLGAFAWLAFFLSCRSKGVPPWFNSLLLLFAVIVVGLMAWTANLGGQVRHTEIRAGAQSPPISNNERNDR